MANQIHLPRDINEKIVEILREKPTTLLNVLSWLLFKKTDQVSVYIKLLESTYSNHSVFQELVVRLGEELDKLEQNPNYRTVMDEMWKNHSLNPDARNFVRGQRLDFQLISEKQQRFELLAICLGISILLRLDVLTPEMLQQWISMLNSTANIPLSLLNIKETLKMFQKLSGNRYEVTTSFCLFLYDFWQNKKRLIKNEISGIRCIKNIVDSFVELATGVAGGFGGEVFGSLITPGIGTLVGGVGAGTASSFVTGTLSDRTTQWIFNLPKDEKLENAFRVLDLACNASNNEINTNFVRLALQCQHNPPSPAWIKLKESVNVIKRLET